MPGLEYCRELNIYWLLDGEERARACQNTINLLVRAFFGQIEQLESCGIYEPEQRLAMYQKAFDFKKIVYGDGDLFSESIYAYKCEFYSALICIVNNMASRAAPYLKQAIIYTKAYDNLPEKGSYTSLLTNRLSFDLLNVRRFKTTVCEDMRETLIRRYDLIKDNVELVELINRICDKIS